MNDMFRLAVEACPAAMILVDDSGSILLVNQECERLFGYRRDHLVGASVDLLVPNRARGAHVAQRRAFGATPNKRPMGEGRDLGAIRADGSEFPAEIGLTPVVGGGVLAVVVDITARVEAERIIRDHAKRLELANESLERFAHVASHDIQEPLRKIAAFADVMKTALADADMAAAMHAADVVVAASRHARHLVRDVLTLAELHRLPLERRRVRISTVVEQVRETLAQAIEDARALVAVEVGETTIDADPAGLERLLVNLVSNALKYHAPGAPAKVRITARTTPEGDVHLVVADEGIGFPGHLADEIFAPFRRLHRGEGHPGTGMGLTIVKAIADAHGWAIAVEAAVGEGARFDVDCGAAHR